MLTVECGIGQLQPVLPGGDIRHLGPDKLDADGLGTLTGGVKVLALGADIYVEDSDIDFRIMLLGHQRLFDGVHTADRRTVAVITAYVS